MSSVLYRLGHWTYANRQQVVLLWFAVTVLVAVAAATLTTGTKDEFDIPGTESSRALDQLETTFPQVAGTNARVVVADPDGVERTQVSAPIADFITAVTAIDTVTAVADPYGDLVDGGISADGQAAVITIQIEGSSTTVPQDVIDALTAATADLEQAVPSRAEVALGGDLFTINVPSISATEGIGVAVALVVLVVTLGSFVAAGMPLLNALLGVAITIAGIFAMTRFTTIVSTTPMLALMLGLAVGIDYTLFIISRHQGQLRAGMDLRESTARAVATAGSAVVFAGLTVMIALVGLVLPGLPFLGVMGIAGAVGVGIAVLVSITLTPALLAFAGERLRPRPHRTQATAEIHPTPVFSGWVRAATRWPVVTIVVVIVGLTGLSLPALNLRLALPDAGTQPAGTGARVAYDLIAEHWGPGYNGPLMITGVIVGSTDPLKLLDDLKAEIETIPGVAEVPLATPNEDATMGVLQVVPTTAPDSEETRQLVEELRDRHDQFLADYGVDLSVTGITAVQIDISTKLGQALLPFALFVVGLSIVLLMMVFRSLWVPITAALGYLLSIGASFGVVALVFEYGVGAQWLGMDRTPQAVMSFMPIVTMGVLFGLAMDYEVFLVARMREEYVHRGNAQESVRLGFLGSAKVVTAAAAIMFSVFIAFVPGHETMLKPIALGLATGVVVDAFLVRMTLIPAVLHLLGDRAWKFPRALDRALPHFDVEGEDLATELELHNWPEPGATDAIATKDLGLHAPGGAALFADVNVRVPAGGALVVAGPHRSGRTALLLTLAGRAHADTGVCKVAGMVASVRARDIRHTVAFAQLTRAVDPVTELSLALESRPTVLVVDDLDAVADPLLREATYRRLLIARRRDPQLTVVVSALSAAAVADLDPNPVLVELDQVRQEARR